MAGPGDEVAGTTGQGHLRPSHADREHVIDALKAAFAQDRLTKDEFDLRLGRTFAARTTAELAMVTADIPVELTGARKLAEVRARRLVNRAVVWGAYGLIAPALFAAAILPDNSAAWGALAPLTFFYFIGWLIAGIMMLASWHQVLSTADSSGIPVEEAAAQPLRKPTRVRSWAAKAAALGIYGIIMPAVFTVAIIPGNTTVRVVVTTAAVIYFIFWLVGGLMMLLALRLGWPRSDT